MQFRLFTIPIVDGKMQEDEMNLFLRSHRIVSVDKYYADALSSWSFCVSFVESNLPPVGMPSKKDKVDYKEVLDEQTFAKFSKLREAPCNAHLQAPFLQTTNSSPAHLLRSAEQT